MSLYSMEALCAFAEAIDNTGNVLTLRDIVRVLEHLDNEGWEIARKPTARAVTVNDPVPAPPPDEPTQWPPAGISRLWATEFPVTDKRPDIPVFVEVESIRELCLRAKLGATFIDAVNENDARFTWNDRSRVVKKTFHACGSTFEYLTDEIPF